MATRTAVSGDVESGFGRVADAFERNFAHGEVGAALAVFRDGKPLIDIWAGMRDAEAGLAWQADTIVPVFSTTKGITALVLGTLHSRGVLDYDATVASYWPEFAQHGKDAMTVRQLLAHSGGLAVLDESVHVSALFDLDALAVVLAAQKPMWTPGERTAYHANTIGYYANEIARRVDPQHRSIGTILAQDLAAPLDLRFYIGLPEDVDISDVAVLGRLGPVALLRQLKGVNPRLAKASRDPRSTLSLALNNPIYGHAEKFSRRKVLGPEGPASTGVGNARSIAKLYGLAAMGAAELPIDAATLAMFAEPVGEVIDEGLKIARAYSLGFSKPTSVWSFGSPGGRSYGTAGLGGSIGFADPVARLGYSYTPNRLGISLTNDPRDTALQRELYRALG